MRQRGYRHLHRKHHQRHHIQMRGSFLCLDRRGHLLRAASARLRLRIGPGEKLEKRGFGGAWGWGWWILARAERSAGGGIARKGEGEGARPRCATGNGSGDGREAQSPGRCKKARGVPRFGLRSKRRLSTAGKRNGPDAAKMPSRRSILERAFGPPLRPIGTPGCVFF